jgi:hypothetical protein
VLALPASAADYYHLRDYVTNTYGSAVSGASVRVYNPNTTTAASSVYTDMGGSTAVTWPLATDSNGMFECYLPTGNYDINIVHAGHSISTTWDNYFCGTVASVDSLSYVKVDTIKSASDDTVHVRASDGARHGILKTNQLVLEDALGHGDDRAAIRFGSKTATEACNARLYFPKVGVFWASRPGYNARVPQLDGTTYDTHNALGVGGTTGEATNWQWWEDVALYWAHPRADSTATSGSRYEDRAAIEFGRRLRPLDSAYTGKDTLRCDAYQSLNIKNDRGSRLRWMWIPRNYSGSPPDSLHAARASPYGTPEYGIRFMTDLPDSNSDAGSRDAVQIRWTMLKASGSLANAGSSFLTMKEHDTESYVFARDHIELRPGKEGSVNKSIKFYGSAGDPTKLKLDDAEGSFLAYVTNGQFNIYHATGSANTAEIDVYQVDLDVSYIDTLKAGTGTNHYMRAADGQNDATLNVDNVTMTGDLKGARVWVGFDNNGASNVTTDVWLRTLNTLGSALRGHPTPVAGSVKGYAVRYNIDSYNAGAYAVTRFYIDGAKTFADSFYIDATGWHDSQTTFARDTYTFSAGSFLSAEFDIEGTLQYDVPIVTLDLQLDD